MIDPRHELTITRLAQPVGISRAALYYALRPPSQGDLLLWSGSTRSPGAPVRG